MFSKLVLTWLVASISFFIFYNCSDSTNPNPVSNDAYMILNVGDERQIINTSDSTTDFMKITGTTKRADGMNVFICIRTSGIFVDTSYLALKDSFYIATELDTVRNENTFIKENPFREQRLAKLYPAEGDTWIHTSGDNSTLVITAKYFGSKTVPSGIFNDVYGFHFADLMTIYYARGIGYIGTKIDQNSPEFVTIYLKIGGREYGKLFPTKNSADINVGPGLTVREQFTRYGFFGEKIDR